MLARSRAVSFGVSIILGLFVFVSFSAVAQTELKVAFIADQGSGSDAVAVLNLIASEGADMVLHQGDFDYSTNPTDWDDRISGILGPDFPYFATVGNHDTGEWSGANGYQAKLIARLGRVPGASCNGDLGVQSACTYRGLFFILSGAGTIPNGQNNASHIAYITDQLAQTSAPMRICSWHKNQSDMQVGGKSSEVGWGPYEACREGGAIIATGHEHSYSRTHLLDHMETKSVASTSNTLQIENGKTFAFVSGLGGRSVRGQSRSGAWWASIYTSDQGASHGGLFCTFFVGGDPNRASCYFKDINGVVPDQFEIVSLVSGLVANFSGAPLSGEAPLVADFDASSSTSSVGSITTYDWDFGDGTSGSGQFISHEFSQIGTYTVTLTVTNDSGDTATTSRTVTTTGPLPNQAPTALFTATPSAGDVPLSVSLDASGSTDPDGTISLYHWDFGDGSTFTGATGTSVSHLFELPDFYTVTLTVTDDEGATHSTTRTIAAGVVVPVIDIRVATGNDDAEERQSGSMYLTSTDLELVDDGSRIDQTVGMRFAGVDIPQGATIIDASIQFQVDETDSDPTSLVIRGQAADDSAAFASVDGNITSRPVTTASVDWSPPAWTSTGVAGEDQRTPDLSAIVQEIVDRPDWSPGNAMVIIVEGSGVRTAESYNGSSSAAPLLHIEYDPDPNIPPVAVAGASPTVGEVPLTVQFSSAGSSDPDGTIAGMAWTFGDGTGDAGPSPSHTYTSSGLYTAILTVTDDAGADATAEVVISIVGPPATDDVAVQGPEDAASIAVTLSGSDAGGTVTGFALDSLPANGTLYADGGLATAAAPGIDYAAAGGTRTMYFVPAADWNGATGFGFAAKDDSGTPDPTPATAAITVSAVNDPPGFAASDPPAVDEDSGTHTVNGWITAFDPGPANEAGQSVQGYIVGSIGNPGLFAAGPSVDVGGTLSYIPAADAMGSSTFQVRVRDDGGVADGGVDISAPQTFTITVNGVNDLPVAVDDSATTSSPASGNVLANDDQGDAPATVTGNTDPANGSVTIDGAGNYTYTPDPGFSGTDSFTYTITDANGDTSTATVTITVSTAPQIVFADSFENGLSNWTQDQNDWFTRDRRATDGDISAEVDGNADDAELVSPVIDVAGRTQATIAFSWYIESGLDSGEYLAFDVSLDGGPWQERASLRGNVDQESVTHDVAVPVDVTGAANVRLRFRARMSGSSEDANLDNVVVTVTGSGPIPEIPPSAGFSFAPAFPGPGQPVVFTDASSEGSAPVNAWSWTFGDGTGSTERHPAHAYATSGSYEVSLTVTDDKGATGLMTQTVVVSDPGAEVTVFADSFESGLVNWTQDQNDWFTRDRRATDGDISAEVDGNADDAELVSPVIDVAGRTQAIVAFSWYIESGLDSGEYLAFDVSVDGGATWQERASLRGNVDQESVTHDVQIPVDVTGAANVRLRFRARMSKSSEDANLDNVIVTAESSL